MCMIGDDYVTLLRNEWRCARKEHLCAECSRIIERGERYLVESWVYDGRMGGQKTCSHCHHIARQWLWENCDGWIYGAVHDDIAEHWPDGAESSQLEMGRVLVGLRRKWRRRDGQLMHVCEGTA